MASIEIFSSYDEIKPKRTDVPVSKEDVIRQEADVRKLAEKIIQAKSKGKDA